MRQSPYVLYSEYKKHLDGDWRTVHNLWRKIRNYAGVYGYSKTEVDAFFEGESGGKKQVDAGNVIGLTQGSIPFAAAGGALTEANADFNYNSGTKTLSVDTMALTGGSITDSSNLITFGDDVALAEGEGLAVGGTPVADTIIIETSNTDDPTFIFKTTNTAHQINISLDESQANDILLIEGKTASVNTQIDIIALDGENAGLRLYSGAANYGALMFSAGDNLNLKNSVQDKDLIFGIDDGGVAKTITWDADVDKLKHSAGLFDFDDDDLITAGTIAISRTNAVAAGDNGLDVHIVQSDDVTLTGTLRGAYITASNGDNASAGTIRGAEIKARAGYPGETGANVGVLEAISASADAKTYTIGTLRGAEISLDGAVGASITLAVGLRIANNFQADIATTSYGIQIYADSFAYDADIIFQSGATIDNIINGIVNVGGKLRVTENSDTITFSHDGTDAYIKTSDGHIILSTDEGINTHAVLDFKGKGIGLGYIRMYDQDKTGYLEFYCSNDKGIIRTQGASPGILIFQHIVAQDIQCWPNIPSGNPYFYRFGYKVAVGVKYLRDYVDAGGFARIEGEDGVTLAQTGGKLGFYGLATPIIQQAHIADSAGDDAATVNAILAVLENLGLLASA